LSSEQGRPKRSSMIRESAIYSSLTLVSRIAGLARDVVITAKLGASATMAADAYNTMLTFPNLFRRIFAEGAFTAAFVPAYSRTLKGEGEEAADQLARDALASLAAMTVAFSIACIIAMPWLMMAINPGFVADQEKYSLAVLLTQISMMYLPCMAVAALLSGVLNARGRFIVSGAFPIILNIAMIATVLPAENAVQGAKYASVGVLVAGILQAGLVWWGARRAGARIRLVRPRLTPEVKGLIKLALPAAFAASATQINIFVSGILASYVHGGRSWLNMADRFYQLPLGLVGVAIGVALLPRLSQALQAKEHDEAQGAMDQALVLSMALTLPAAAALMSIPYFLIDGFFGRGLWSTADSRETAAILFHYGWGVAAFVLLRILQPAFYARQDTKAPMRFALLSVAVNIGLGVVLFRLIGVSGIAAATAVAAWLNVLQMVVTLARRGEYRPSARAWSKLVRVLAASAGMAAVLILANYYRPALEAIFGRKELAVAVVSLAGMIVYPVLLLALGGVTIAEVRGLVRRGQAAAPPADPLP
jgi:putative peptidoglycan lipid II flippase